MRSAALLAAVVVVSGCAHSDEWTRRDTALQLTYTGAVILDAVQTAEIQDHPDLYEAGMARHFLGSQPSTRDTWLYFSSVAIGHYLIARALPAKWRPYWQGSTILLAVDTVIDNCDVGLGPWCSYEPTRDTSLDIAR